MIADRQGVGESRRSHQHTGVAGAFEQCIGGNGGAHADGVNRGTALLAGLRKDQAYAMGGGVHVALRGLTQELATLNDAVRTASDDVGEGAAAIDPELPARCTHAVSLRSACLRSYGTWDRDRPLG